jgi:hypothetical protein
VSVVTLPSLLLKDISERNKLSRELLAEYHALTNLVLNVNSAIERMTGTFFTYSY